MTPILNLNNYHAYISIPFTGKLIFKVREWGKLKVCEAKLEFRVREGKIVFGVGEQEFSVREGKLEFMVREGKL